MRLLLVSRRSKRDQSINWNAQNPPGGECKDFYKTSKNVESNYERSSEEKGP